MKKRIIFHPFLFAFYPITAVYIQNIDRVPFFETISSFLITIFLTIAVWGYITQLIKDEQKAALITSVFLMLFFSYGHVMTALASYLHKIFGIDEQIIVGLHTRPAMLTLLLVWIFLFVLIMVLTWKSKLSFTLITKYMNMVSLVLMIIAVLQATSFHITQKQDVRIFDETKELSFDLPSTSIDPIISNAPPGDIYYIILDGYARNDVMNELYDYDNSAFIEFLKSKGFFVADQSLTNYCFTFTSLSSSLNFEYLDELASKMDKSDTNIMPIVALLRNNRVMRLVEQRGYETVIFPSGYSAVESIDADVRLSYQEGFNAFQDLLVNTTPLRFSLQKQQYDMQRRRILFTLESLVGVANDNHPRFIFAHLLSPHPPFVFNADGSSLNPDWEFMLNDGDTFTDWIGQDQYKAGYRNQAIFITHQAEYLIEHLLALDPPPIIILQSDHGPGMELNGYSLQETNIQERFSILNAYYFPDQNYTQLYSTITPVNSFRVIMNQYFGMQYELLADRSFWTARDYPYDQIEVSNLLQIP